MIVLADPPSSVALLEAVGVEGPDGQWFCASNQGAHAELFAAPPLPVVLLHHIEADAPGSGHGTALLAEILAWCDERRLSVRLICDGERIAWYTRHGFVRLGPKWDSWEMARPAKETAR